MDEEMKWLIVATAVLNFFNAVMKTIEILKRAPSKKRKPKGTKKR